MDRLLGNHAMQEALQDLPSVGIVASSRNDETGGARRLDWLRTGLYLLRAGLPLGGRAILLHARVVTHKKLANKDIHEEFLRTLATIIPALSSHHRD
ncbi:MAG: hypothetical protein IPM35_34965 [Myxococcales bacterium]|nr:hypothetical protein [Myxococcales bacterium]